MSCFSSPLLPPYQLFWDLYQASNLKLAHFVDKILTFLNLNICYVIWKSFSFHFIQIKKMSQHFRNSGCKHYVNMYEWEHKKEWRSNSYTAYTVKLIFFYKFYIE